MSAKYNVREREGVTIVDAVGRITLGDGSSRPRDLARDLASQKKKKVIFNLAEVSYMDSSAIWEMTNSFTTLSNIGGTLKLLSLTKRVKDLLQISKLYTVFEVFENEDEAVKSFQ